MTQDDIIQIARKRANLLLQTIRRYFPHIPSNDEDTWSLFLDFANAVYASGAAAEREECAKIAEEEFCICCWDAETIAKIIRARGQQ